MNRSFNNNDRRSVDKRKVHSCNYSIIFNRVSFVDSYLRTIGMAGAGATTDATLPVTVGGNIVLIGECPFVARFLLTIRGESLSLASVSCLIHVIPVLSLKQPAEVSHSKRTIL